MVNNLNTNAFDSTLNNIRFSPSINDTIEVEVQTSQPLKNYTFQLVIRGKIIGSQTFHLPDNTSNSHQFKFPATYDLLPEAYLLVYFVKGNQIISTKCNLSIKKQLNNHIDVEINPNTANPGQIVEVGVKTTPKSFVGLLGLDQSVLLLKSGHDLSEDEAFSELDSFSSQTQRRIQSYGVNTSNIPNYYNAWEDFEVSKDVKTKCSVFCMCNPYLNHNFNYFVEM